MRLFLALAILSSVALAQLSTSAGSKSAQDQGTASSASGLIGASARASGLPPAPNGKSTVIGGAIRGVDRVRDQFTLDVFGGRAWKILFDERTQIYRDGVKGSIRDLRAGDHVSVETVLDGTTVFARSIRMLSVLPEGDCQGQVTDYDPADHELTVRDAQLRQLVKFRVPDGTAFVRQGQAASSAAEAGPADLVAGTLISVKFQSDNKGHGVASQVAILATPGTAFVFVGNVVSLDLHSGLLVVVDPRDDKRYDVFFDSARFPISRDLHEGADVMVTAEFDGARYVANAITIRPAAVVPER
ncbi:MAG: DUF5666 domain-containing protein [Candidatus Sulfotelmatobacter sp.]